MRVSTGSERDPLVIVLLEEVLNSSCMASKRLSSHFGLQFDAKHFIRVSNVKS